jgi:hypothetical protein
VDHLQRQTDRPVPNEQHRESHSLKYGSDSAILGVV